MPSPSRRTLHLLPATSLAAGLSARSAPGERNAKNGPWRAMTALANRTDMDHGDLLARAGSVWFDRPRSGGGVRSGARVHAGWQGRAAII